MNLNGNDQHICLCLWANCFDWSVIYFIYYIMGLNVRVNSHSVIYVSQQNIANNRRVQVVVNWRQSDESIKINVSLSSHASLSVDGYFSHILFSLTKKWKIQWDFFLSFFSDDLHRVRAMWKNYFSHSNIEEYMRMKKRAKNFTDPVTFSIKLVRFVCLFLMSKTSRCVTIQSLTIFPLIILV